MAVDRNKKEILSMELKIIMSRIMKIKDSYNDMKIESKEMIDNKSTLVNALNAIKSDIESLVDTLDSLSEQVLDKRVELNKLDKECKEVHRKMQELHEQNKIEERMVSVKRTILDKDINQQLKKQEEVSIREKNASELDIKAKEIISKYNKKLLELQDMISKYNTDKGQLAIIREETFNGQEKLRKEKKEHDKRVKEYKDNMMNLNNDRKKVKNIQNIVKKLLEEKAWTEKL